MNLIVRIQIGKDLIVRGRSLGMDTTAVEVEVENLQSSLKAEVSRLKLSEFENRHIALPYDSRVLGEYVWFCSDDDIAAQIRTDEPAAVTYTVCELREIINLKPNPEDLKAIHNAKSVFPNSHIVDSKLNNKNEEKEN